MTFLLVFIILSIINVIFSTVRSITTIKSGTLVASLVSGGYFAFYNIMLIYTVADFPMWQKCLITFFCNIFGVAIVKLIEKKMQKDKLWLVSATVKERYIENLESSLRNVSIPYTAIPTNDRQHYVVNIYCNTQSDSQMVKSILMKYYAKWFVSESKTL